MKYSGFSDDYLKHFTSLESINVPRPVKILAWCIILFIIGLVAFLVFVPWVQTTTGEGSITTFHPSDRPQSISAPVKGRIREWYVHEGNSVKKGDALLEIVDNDPRFIERLELELDAAKKKADVARAAAETSKLDLVRKENLFAQGLSSQRDLEISKIEYNQYQATEASALAELAKVETRRSRQDTQLVRAPADGIIVQMRSGAAATFVKEGDIVAHFIPTGTITAVELYVKGLDMPLIYTGAKVRLQFEGWPAVQFSGWPAVSVGSFGGIVTTVDPSVSPNGLFRVLIVQDPDEVWPSSHYLRFGARARGWIMFNTVNVGYELWRQLNSFPPLPPAGAHLEFLTPQKIKETEKYGE